MSSRRSQMIRFWAYPAVVIALWVATSAFTVSQLTTVIPSLTAESAVQPATQQIAEPAAQACLDRC